MDQLPDKRHRPVGGQGLLAHRRKVRAEFGDLVFVAPADQVTADAFDEQQPFAGIVETKQYERPHESRVRSCGERDDLHRDAWPFADVEQMLQLPLHDRRAADPPVQRLLAEHKDRFKSVFAPQQALLALLPHLHDPVGFLARGVRLQQPGRVLLGVQEAGDEVGVEGADR